MKLGVGLCALLGLAGCQPLVIDHTPAGNLVDPQSSAFDASDNAWSAWFATSILHVPEGGAEDGGFLRVEVTQPFGWGIHVDKYPGYEAKPGTYRGVMWARAEKGSGLKAALKLSWLDRDINELSTSELTTSALTSAWQQFSFESTAPAQTAWLGLSVTGRTEDTGELIDFDGLLVVPKP